MTEKPFGWLGSLVNFTFAVILIGVAALALLGVVAVAASVLR